MKKKIICTLIFILSSLLLKANTLTGYDTKVLFSSGIFEDPVNYIKYIPGVSAPFKYSTLFSMYGGKPGLNTYVFDSILIRKPYILNNLLSSINPLIIDSINLSVNSGVISLKSKKPSPKTGLTITHTIADTNSYINIALSHFSFLQIAARISHITAPLTFFKNELAQIGLSISPTPLYADLFLQFTYKKMFLTFTQSVIFRDESAENYHTGKHAYSDIYENSHLTYEGKNLFFHNQWNFDLTNNDSVNFRIGYEFYNNGYNYQLHETGTGYFSEDLRQKFKELTTLPLYIDSFYVDNLELKVNEVEKYHSIQSELKYNLKRDVSELNSGCGILVDYYNKSKDNIMYGHYIKDLTFTYGETVTVGVPIYQPEYIKNENDYGVINYYWFLNHAMIINDELSFKFGISIDGFLLKNFEKNLFSIPVIKPYFSINYLYSFNSMHIQSFLFSFESGISSDNFRDISYQTILEKFNNNYALPAEQYMYSNLTINITSPYIDIHTSAHAKVYTHNLYDIENNFTFDANGYFFNANIALSKQYSNKIYLYSGYSYSMNMRSKEVNNTFIYREVEYNRPHIFNFIIDVTPINFLSVLFKFSIVSGTIKKTGINKELVGLLDKEYNQWQIIAQKINLYELWYGNNYYDFMNENPERTSVALPLDVKITFKHYFPNARLHLECYAGVEDLLSIFYKPDLNDSISIDKWTGTLVESATYQFGMGSPIPSTGIKISF